MSRRDTIIVAVLANAALLMILFATAARPGDQQKVNASNLVDSRTSSEGTKSNFQKEIFDEYIASTVPTSEEMTEEIIFNELPFPEAIVESPVDEMITYPATIHESKSSSSENKHFVNVTVKKGDFLEKIAKANETSVSAIMKANNLASTQLKVGQVLKVPVKDGEKAIQNLQHTPSRDEFYVVKEGDNPWLIASRNQVKLDELLRLNGLDEQKARRLRPGDRLRIR